MSIKLEPYIDKDNFSQLLEELRELKETNKEFYQLLQQQDHNLQLISQQVATVESKVDDTLKDLNKAQHSYFSWLRSKLLLSAGIGLVIATPVGVALGAKYSLGAFCFSSISSLFY